MDKQLRQKFYEELSYYLKRSISGTTVIADLRLDSMFRSEVLFMIEDIFGKNIWPTKIQDFTTFEDLLNHVESQAV